MTWEVGNSGMEMQLSSSVPKIIEKSIKTFSSSLIPEEISLSECDWAVHPGGKAILESVEKACMLKKEQTIASWKVLSEYGNMSSATFLFVLSELLTESSRRSKIVGLGFGPGLSVEGVFLERMK